ncbi:class II fructose-bisphosphatase [Pullulanibacillus sp. KACC 23026]|uniref:class II fructose-bisphosphatase n=1 Tax=Pullulanibacillus sp. KACC 23026 TaxID=3028315 RepID=UPI0023AF86D7|nr:class II fructose-bisphosphatase [Pullulanibacillus sp. KACC 23026]WEG12451.1 class II fructose-bisphosphatase [Pullulanibacillus sp. KACC 23026]
MGIKNDLAEPICTQHLVMEFLAVSQQAAMACYPFVGRRDKMEADGAGTKAMRQRMNQIDMNGVIVIGEGEMDEAPMLYIDEKLGTGKGPHVDIAVDPVEGTNLMATGRENSLVVMAVADRGSLLHAPDMYMEKIAVGPKAKGVINIESSLTENMRAVAAALGKDVSELTVMIQDRPRHESYIQQVLQEGASVKLFSDVDITGAIATAFDDINVDILVGIGGAPEGVITAAALKCLGGDFQARLVPQNEAEVERCKKMGIENPEKALKLDEIVRTDDCFFVATGITDGMLLKGAHMTKKHFLKTHSLVITGGNMKSTQFVTGEFPIDSNF